MSASRIASPYFARRASRAISICPLSRSSSARALQAVEPHGEIVIEDGNLLVRYVAPSVGTDYGRFQNVKWVNPLA